ncbi:MAG: Lipopolysaccharide assembly protein B [Candidatus Marinimicrobia bacterium]|nr:Lipopolysaccharide assembly protein B [Candidatus Neomarinimicrobiota bacterium]
MEPLYIIIALAVLSIVSLALYFLLRPTAPKKTTESLYSDGLRLLLEGDLEAAADKLKQVVRRDTNHIDAYIKLGDIFRENNQHSQALKVHQSLTVRRNLSQGQQLDIFHSLIHDFRELQQYEKALQYADKMLDIDKKNVKGHEAKLEIYRETNRWEEAAEVLKSIQKITGEEQGKTLALYRVEEGRKLEKAGGAKDGRIQYRKALKTDPKCCAAYYYLGNSYDAEGRSEEAIENWEKFGEICPDSLFLVSENIEQRLFELGNFSEVERYYRRLLESHPDNIEAAVGIASFYDKKGETESAIRSIENALDKAPDSLRARIVLTKMYNKDKSHSAIEDQLDQMLQIVSDQMQLTCENCGYQSGNVHWLCPECHQTNTFFS